MPVTASPLAAALRAALCAAALPALTGCYLEEAAIGAPHTVVERALALCGEKTEAAETECLRKALAEAHLTVAALAATIPGCRPGVACSLRYRTRDREGLFAFNASDYVADWRVTFDLKSASGSAPASGVPFTVQQV